MIDSVFGREMAAVLLTMHAHGNNVFSIQKRWLPEGQLLFWNFFEP